jgi:phage terminase large subunit GpA
MSAQQLERDCLCRIDRRLEFMLRHHCSTRNSHMTFHQRPFLLPLYMDRSQERVFRKSVQCGISELLIIDALESADAGLACLYVMPTQSKRDKFVTNRVSKVIAKSKGYRRRLHAAVGGANSVTLKHFGSGVISFVGSNAENEFIEFPADLAIVDEFDRCCQDNMPLVRDRLAASPHKLTAFASTPTFEGYGISRLFDESDAKEWHVKCEACGHFQPLGFFDNVARQTGDNEYVLLDREWEGNETPGGRATGGDMYRKSGSRERDGSAPGGTCTGSLPRVSGEEAVRVPRQDVRVFCSKCHRPLDRLAKGEWVARHPGRGASGYQISQLFVPTVSVASLWADWQRALTDDFERQRFYNSMLGLPYTAKGSGLALDDLLACCDDYDLPDDAKRCTMGVDVGQWFHVRISDRPQPGVRRAVFVGRVQTIAELDVLLDRYDVQCCVVDAQPEARLVHEWQERHERGRIWRCVYSDDDLHDLRKDAVEGVVRAARTPSLDAATGDIRDGRNRLPRNARTIDGGDYIAQMIAPVRRLLTDARGNKRYSWSKPAADHYRHADNYDRIASQLWRPPTATKIILGQPRIFRAA